MTEQEQVAILTICFMAAATDGISDVEHAEIRRIADRNPSPNIQIDKICQDVVQRKKGLGEVVRELKDPETRKLAYEFAVGACNADGPSSEVEKQFLAGLESELQVNTQAAAETRSQAEVVTTPAVVIAPTSQAAGQPDLEKMISDTAILAGALELLPSSLSTMAIIPLQMRLVYRIGQRYGFQLDQSYIKDFLGTLGVGISSQFIEGIASKILGGLFGGLGRQAASSGMSFATTYALGQVAKQYYAAGRQIDTAQLKQTFAKILEEAKTQKDKYAQQIQQKLNEVKNSNLSSLIKDS
jgi:uncharacterized protein (DUF697 family)